MTTNYHTPLSSSPKTIANAASFNTPLAELDAQISLNATNFALLTTAGGNVATLANGAANAGQKVVTVDSSTGFIAGGRVAYMLVGSALEYNTIDTVDGATQITFDSNIGTGGIPDDGLITMISESEYQAAQSVNHSGSLTLDKAVKYAAVDVHNVLSYGATGLGVADDAAAIQAAMTAAAAKGGGIVYLPPGTYKIASGLTMGANVRLHGAGRADTTLKADATVAGFSMLSATGRSNITIRDIKFDGSKPVISNHGTGIILTNCTNVSIENNEVGNFGNAGIYIYGTTGANDTWIVNNYVHDCGDYTTISTASPATYKWTKNGATNEYYLELAAGGTPGITQPVRVRENNMLLTKTGTIGSLAASCWQWGDGGGGFDTVVVRLSDNTQPADDEIIVADAGNPIGINCLGLISRLQINGNYITGCETYGILVSANGANLIYDIRVIGNVVRVNRQIGIYVTGYAGSNATRVIIANNATSSNRDNILLARITSGTITGNVAVLSGGDQNGDGIVLDTCVLMQVSGNVCNYNRACGINVQSSSYCNIVGNVCYGNNSSLLSNVNGITIYLTSTYNTIVGNMCMATGDGATGNYGIGEVAGGGSPDVNLITDNHVRSNPDGGVVKVGSSSKVRGNTGYATSNQGVATIASGATSIAVTHGLNITPAINNIHVTPTNSMGNATKFWVTSPTSTQFTINVNADPGATTATFSWAVVD